MIRRLTSADSGFAATLDALLHFDHSTDDAIEQTVAEILKRVRTEGDAAVLEFTRRFDQLDAGTMAELELPRSELRRALDGLPAAQRSALEAAAKRVSDYHERQKLESWSFTEADGTRLGQKVTALDRVGLYVPGGKAAYPSSVLMNALPAKVAGVNELIMVVPTPRGEKNALVLAAACLAGVDRVFTIGGAQAVAALAYGTQTIPQVDKIVGPGNAYVAAAKRRVFGTVGIDMVAGPSEVLIIADAGHLGRQGVHQYRTRIRGLAARNIQPDTVQRRNFLPESRAVGFREAPRFELLPLVIIAYPPRRGFKRGALRRGEPVQRPPQFVPGKLEFGHGSDVELIEAARVVEHRGIALAANPFKDLGDRRFDGIVSRMIEMQQLIERCEKIRIPGRQAANHLIAASIAAITGCSNSRFTLSAA